MEKTKELYGIVGMKVNIPQYEILESAREIIKEVFALKNVDGIKNERMYEFVEYHTSHAWTELEDRGIPSAKQKKALEALKLLEETKKLLWEE